MVDTPGLLDRPMFERNSIEMQAIAALENIGDVLLFLIDATKDPTTPLTEQENLLKEVRNLITGKPILIIHTKSDLYDEIPPDIDICISSKTGYGIEELRSIIIEKIAADDILDPLSLPEHWYREDDSIKPIGSPQEILRRQDEARYS